jgi:SAM-dependent methyltransferase
MVTDCWTSGADYEQWMGRWSRLLAQRFLQWLALPTHLQWLDFCCGGGVVSETIADVSAPASVVGVDLSSSQIEFARQHRARHTVKYEVADAMTLPFPDASFDVAVSGLGLNFIPDPLRALREANRVLRPGGALAVYVWDYAQGARFLREFWDTAIAIDPEAAAFDQALRFTICTHQGLRDVFESAKLDSITTHALEIVTHFSNFDDYWLPLLTGQGSAPGYLATRAEQTRAAIRALLQSTLPQNPDGSIDLPARALAVRARRCIV